MIARDRRHSRRRPPRLHLRPRSNHRRSLCGGSICGATIKGRAKKQTLITQIICVTTVDNAQIAYGAATEDKTSSVALAVLPVQSRTVAGTLEYGVLGGPTQVVIGADESFFVGVLATSSIDQAVCSLTGTTTKL